MLPLKVACMDGQEFITEFNIQEAPQVTLLKMLCSSICQQLHCNFFVGEFYDSPLEILPLPKTPTLDQLKVQNVAYL